MAYNRRRTMASNYHIVNEPRRQPPRHHHTSGAWFAPRFPFLIYYDLSNLASLHGSVN
jgi:hypothetical protein